MGRQTVIDETKDHLRDDAKDLELLVAGSIESAVAISVDHAVSQHSKRSPRRFAQDISSTGAFVQDLPSGYIDRETTIVEVEWPVDDDQGEPNYMDRRQWELYYHPTPPSPRIRFLTGGPSTGDSIRFHLEGPHTLTLAATTLSSTEERALAHLAASLCCSKLASKYAQEQSPSISADSADHIGKTERYAANSKKFRRQYFQILGVPDDEENLDQGPKPYSALANFDLPTALPGRPDKLFHRRWDR